MGGEVITLLSNNLQFIAIKHIGNPNKSTDLLSILYKHTVPGFWGFKIFEGRRRGFKPEGLRFSILLPYNRSMKLSRSQIREGLEQIPMQTILGVSSKALTHKQKQFCKEVAMGQTGSEAYRRAYNSKAKTTSVAAEASKLKAKPTIAQTIEAMEGAIQAAAYQTPAGLRALVIQTLVQTMIDPEAKDAVKVAAAKTLGTVTEVAAFTERKETRVITSSEDTKAKLLAKLRDMMKAGAVDAEIIDTTSLLEELKGGEAQPHPPATPSRDQESAPSHLHTIPLKLSEDLPVPLKVSDDLSDSANASNKKVQDLDPTLSIQENPPLGESK